MWIEEYLYRVATDDGKGKSYLMSEALFLFVSIMQTGRCGITLMLAPLVNDIGLMLS